MMRITDQPARFAVVCTINGESSGQEASQTPREYASHQCSDQYVVTRPVVTMDKVGKQRYYCSKPLIPWNFYPAIRRLLKITPLSDCPKTNPKLKMRSSMEQRMDVAWSSRSRHYRNRDHTKAEKMRSMTWSRISYRSRLSIQPSFSNQLKGDKMK